MLSVPHLIVIFVVVLVVFGPQKLPELARGLGKLMAEFRKASLDFRASFEEEMRDLERQAREVERRKHELADKSAGEASTPPSEETSAAEPPASGSPDSSGSPPESVARGSEATSTAEEIGPAPEDTLHDQQRPA